MNSRQGSRSACGGDRRRAGAILVVLLALCASCSRGIVEAKPTGPAVRMELLDEATLLSNVASTDASWVPLKEPAIESWVPVRLPVEVVLGEGELTCTRFDDGPTIRYLTFERAGERMSYGVYGLKGYKNGILVTRPLSGEPVTWPNLDHAQAFERQLRSIGLSGDRARELVTSRGPGWFAEGLRVFFFLDEETASGAGFPDFVHTDRPFLIHVECR